MVEEGAEESKASLKPKTPHLDNRRSLSKPSRRVVVPQVFKISLCGKMNIEDSLNGEEGEKRVEG